MSSSMDEKPSREEPELALHPQKIAKLACKTHEFLTLDNETDYIRKVASDCLDKIEDSQEVCDETLEKLENCLLACSDSAMKLELEKIDKFYVDAKRTAFRKLYDFAKSRTKTLQDLKDQYTIDKLNLDKMSSTLRSIKEMEKTEVIENGENVGTWIAEAGKKVYGPKDPLLLRSYTVTYPTAELMKIKIDVNPSDPPNNVRLESRNRQKTIALYSNNYGWVDHVLASMQFSQIEDRKDGRLYKCKDGRTLFRLKYAHEDSIKLSQYKYIAVAYLYAEREDLVKEELEYVMNHWWSKTFIVIDRENWIESQEFVDRLREMTKADKRVEVVQFKDEVFDSMFDLE